MCHTHLYEWMACGGSGSKLSLSSVDSGWPVLQDQEGALPSAQPVRASTQDPSPTSPTGLPGGSWHRGKKEESSPQISMQGTAGRTQLPHRKTSKVYQMPRRLLPDTSLRLSDGRKPPQGCDGHTNVFLMLCCSPRMGGRESDMAGVTGHSSGNQGRCWGSVSVCVCGGVYVCWPGWHMALLLPPAWPRQTGWPPPCSEL